MEGKTLDRKLRSSLKYNYVNVKDLDGKVNIDIIEPGMDFFDMFKKRTPVDRDIIQKDLASEGHLFANLGVSAILTITLFNNDYLILEEKTSKENSFLTFISGYIEDVNIKNPLKAIKKEIVEELLPITLSGHLLKYKIDDEYLNAPFISFQFDESYLELSKGAKFSIPTNKRSIEINYKLIETEHITYHAHTNSTQLIFDWHIIIPEVSQKILNGFYNTKEEVKGDYLETILNKNGIVLAKINNKKLTGKFYLFNEKNLYQIDTKNFYLSEYFTRPTDGIFIEKEIKLSDCLSTT